MPGRVQPEVNCLFFRVLVRHELHAGGHLDADNVRADYHRLVGMSSMTVNEAPKED